MSVGATCERPSRVCRTLLVLVACLLAAQGQALAQEKWAFDARAGIAVPAGDLSDLLGTGPAFGVGVAYSLSPRVALRLDGELEILGKDEGGDEARLWHYTAGLGVELTNPDARTISIAAIVAAGGTSFNTRLGLRLLPGGELPERLPLLQTSFTLATGLRVAGRVSDKLKVFLDAGWRLMLVNADARENQFGRTEGFDEVSSFPITAGLAVIL